MNHTIASFDFIPNPTGPLLDDKSFVSSALAQQRERDAEGHVLLGLLLVVAVLAIVLVAWRLRTR